MPANLQSLNTLISFYVSLFTDVPVYEALQVIANKLRSDDALADRLGPQVVAIMELVEFSLRTTYIWDTR
jgi:hypothetical protein